jgi:hypothetical protein
MGLVACAGQPPASEGSSQAASPTPLESPITVLDPNAEIPLKVAQATDGKSEVELLDGWTEETDLHESAEIQIAERSKDLYLIVLSENKESLQQEEFEDLSLDTYATVTLELLNQRLTEPELVQDATSMQVQDYPAVQYQIQGSIDGVTAKYLFTVVDTGDRFYQILAWTTPEQFASHEDDFQKIVQSLQILEGEN